jgi:UDP-N-acetylglucosamine 2-epimerase (non-hydrolysing)
MLDQVLDVFGIEPDIDLDLMRPNQTLSGLTSRLITALDEYIRTARPDMVLVQGDTTTAFCGALAAFYQRVPVGHVEAGLRTWDKAAPYPEEINRQLVTRLADLHFAPTGWARDNLLREHVDPQGVFVVGNTVIDALLLAREEVRKRTTRGESPLRLLNPGLQTALALPGRRLVLITGHRRENFGEGFENICRAIAALAERFGDVEFVYPVHLNPNVREPVYRTLGKRANIHLLEPLSYLVFVALMDRAYLLLTDSGGVQEEAPSLGKPVLVLRETTERPEALTAGTVRLVGTDFDHIFSQAAMLLTDPAAYAQMANLSNPYGDGKAAARIIGVCEATLRGSLDHRIEQARESSLAALDQPGKRLRA